MAQLRGLAVMTMICSALVACGDRQADDATSNAPVGTPLPTSTTPAPTPTAAARGPTEPGDTAWYELTAYATGVPTATGGDLPGEFLSGHIFHAGTLDAGRTVRLDFSDDHAFADGPRGGLVILGSDDGTTSELQLVDAENGGTSPVLTTEQLVWGGTLSPDGTAVYYVPVDRASMADTGLWRLDLAEGSEEERVIEVFASGAYDFASQIRFEWTPDGEHLIGQYCNRGECRAHILATATDESRLHEEPGVFELRGATDSEYVADAYANQQRSGILAVDLETLDVRVLAEEWGVSEVLETRDGPVVVYLAPSVEPWNLVLVGIPLEGKPEPFVVYEDRGTDAPPENHPKSIGDEYEAPEGWMLLWPGSPGAEGDSEGWDPTFLLFEILGDEGLTYPYEYDPPR